MSWNEELQTFEWIKNVKALVHHSHSLENTKKCLQDFIFVTRC